MKSVKCSDLGTVCDFVAQGETAAEIKQLLLAHGMSAHADLLTDLSEDDKKMLEEKVDRLVAG